MRDAVMKYQQNRIHLLIPEKLVVIIEEIRRHPPIIVGFRISRMQAIIHFICTKRRDDGYSHLKMSVLRELIPCADKYVEYLITKEIIESDGYYQPGNKSYGYKFTKKYESKYLPYPLTDAALNRRIICKYYQVNKTGYSKQNKFIQKMVIDDEAFPFAYDFYKDLESLNYAIAAIQSIQNGLLFCTVDDTSFRFHSNITTLAKDMRRFVVIKGNHLKYNVDIKNSQPYFSTLLLTSPQSIACFAKGEDLRMMLKSLHVEHNEEVTHYINLVCCGKFYEYLIVEFNKRGLIRSRDQVKDDVMKILFDRNSHLPKSRRIFAELFPTIHKVFSKLRGNRKGDHFESYKRFAILLQTIESHIVLKVILNRLYKEYPDVIALTVHDSILCTADPDKVEKIMKEELKKFVGRPPILKTEMLQKNVISSEMTIKGPRKGDEGGRKRKERIGVV
jgi:hypothetical protein